MRVEHNSFYNFNHLDGEFEVDFVRKILDLDLDLSGSVLAVCDYGESRSTVLSAAWSAALALSTRHLIDTNGYNQQHYDLLVAPLAAVIGPVHPDDKPQD